MKKVSKPENPDKTKATKKDKKDEINPLLDVIENMDPDTLTALLHSMQRETGFAPELLSPEDPVELFSEYLDSCAHANANDDDKNEIIADLFEVLDELRVARNGGDPEARAEMQAIYDLLDDAIEHHSLPGPDLMMIGKLLHDAGWVVPDSLKQALTEAVQARAPNMGGARDEDLASSLLEAAEAGQNSFEIYKILSSFLACFPFEACSVLLSGFVVGKRAELSQAVAGFLLHADAGVAQSVAAILAASAGKTPVGSSLIERLVRMRPWVPQSRQAQLDSTIRAMRLNALPPIKVEAPKTIKCYASVCDGSGTRSLFVTQRLGRNYQIATVMLKPSGVADALVVREISKSEMDGLVREMRSSITVEETNLAAITRMLALAISDNFVSGNPPPFELVEVAESLGLGPVYPDNSSPSEIISGLLSTLPPEQTNAAATAKAHADILDSDFAHQWFEAGEALEDLLFSVRGSKRRADNLVKAYLPGRRIFWARQCALSALVLRDGAKADHSLWKQLALVGRDIASELPLDKIPLMKRIAELSVRVFESRL